MEERWNGLFFRSGWQEFVKDNSLELGDFLIFKYVGKSTFNVKIYGRNACEKDRKLAKKNNDYPTSLMKKGKQIKEKIIIGELEPDDYKGSFGKKAINYNKIFRELKLLSYSFAFDY